MLHIGSVVQMRKNCGEVRLTPGEAEGMTLGEHFPGNVVTVQKVSVFIRHADSNSEGDADNIYN